ncbi:pentatricopeptide repeat-containing protein [Senna tora]|uniref:Pentatricopeptide repeat-containing protein n=1 Tax=Senna tora TaxID=362788 RepID=A0A834T6V2_9FABA|nr:pentatricopeptide repeat-containing protein [Senna tora]
MAVHLFIRFPIAIRTRKSLSLFFSPFSSSPSSPSSDEESVVTTVVSILSHHRSKSRWSRLRSLYPNGFNPTDFSKITLQLKNKPHLALQFFRYTKSLCNHNLSSYSTIVHILARGRLKSHAQEVIRTAIRASKLQDNDDEHHLGSAPLKVFSNLVKTYKDCGSAPFVFDLLIKACLESKKVEPSIEIMRLLQSRGINLKVSTLNSLIYCVCQCRGVDAGYEIYREVKEIWDEMGELNCAPNAYSYTVLMAAFCEEGRLEDAEKLWVEMRNEEMEPDVVSYNTLISGFCKTGNVRRAEEFFREMEVGGIESTATTYEHLIKGYFDIGDIDSAILVYKDMCRKAFKPEALTLDMMIRLLCDKLRVHEALEFLRYAMDKFDLFPKEKSYEALIKGLCYEGKMEEALKLQVEMVGKGFRPNVDIYNAFIDGYIRHGNEEMAEALRKEMLQTQIQS